jgi:hypothetical protein
MKKLITLVLVMGLSFSFVKAQDGNQTLINDFSLKKVGFMAEVNAGASSLSDATLGLMGLRAGAVFSDKLSVGGFYRFTFNNPVPSEENFPGNYTPFDSYGAFLEYTVMGNKAFHLTFPLYIGVGELDTDDEDFSPDFGESNFLVVEPGVMLEVNLLDNLRLNAGVLYGFTGNFNYRFWDQSDLQGLRFQMGLKAGLFRR